MIKMVPAFPGAEGGGATATGGRGGRIIVVTNTDATGQGSLYAALKETGTRTIVFQTSGIIDWSSITDNGEGVANVAVDSGDLTVAGQTAPGYGITIKGGRMSLKANNIIIRYITMRGGVGVFGDIISLKGSRHIIDHVTFNWADDDLWGIWNYGGGTSLNSGDTTLQWSILSEGFLDISNPWAYKAHPINVGAGGYSTATTPYFYNVSIHHNFMSQTNERMPQVKNADASIVNNILYNSVSAMSQFRGAGTFDFIGNLYKNNILDTSQREIGGRDKDGVNDMGIAGTPSIYVYGNKNMAGNIPATQWSMVSGHDYYYTAPPSNWQRFTPNTPDTHPITVNSVNDLDTLILPTVGNSRYINSTGAWVNRIDVARSRQIQDYISSIGTPKTSLSQYCTTGCTNGYPTYYKVNPYTDSDNDGISDVWAAANGINADNPANKITANGYSNLENFINGEHNLTCPLSECNITITQ